jgi:prophage maintenance system killer protein
MSEHTKENLLIEMRRRLAERVTPMIRDTEYLSAAVDTMFEVAAEYLAALSQGNEK